jgi:hypothetical protein
MTKKVQLPKTNKGKGYVGTWRHGKIGWWMPEFVSGPPYIEKPNAEAVSKGFLKGERVFLCEIIVKPLKDKKGRPITKIIK